MISIIFLTLKHFFPYQVFCGTPVSKTDGCGGVLVEVSGTGDPLWPLPLLPHGAQGPPRNTI